MYGLSEISLKRLATCDKRLQKVFRRVSRKFDIRILCGYRDKEAQERAYLGGNSNLHYPDSNHNKQPSLAIDVAPGFMENGRFCIDWKDVKAFSYMAGYALRVAEELKIDMRWGGDWDSDGQVRDNKFQDLPHFEVNELTKEV